MINFHTIAEWARTRANARLGGMRPADKSNPRAWAAANQLFTQRLVDACQRVRDNPMAAPVGLFIALPERLLEKAAYLCLGPERDERKSSATTEIPSSVRPETAALLREYHKFGDDAMFFNMETASEFSSLKSVLLCHGLSPIGDSILLLADIGRGHRVASVLGMEVSVMLADISWMSSNRSIRQFESLTAAEIDAGLRICLDKRTRLYSALGLAHRTHVISAYDRAGVISGRKLAQISSRYLGLARAVWGAEIERPLDHDALKTVARGLELLSAEVDTGLPSHIKTLCEFPGVMGSLETSLKSHLEILRVIAKTVPSLQRRYLDLFFCSILCPTRLSGQSAQGRPDIREQLRPPVRRSRRSLPCLGRRTLCAACCSYKS